MNFFLQTGKLIDASTNFETLTDVYFFVCLFSNTEATPKQQPTVNLRNFTCNGKRNIRQLIRVTPVGSGNPRSILLPVSLKDMKEVRTIKIINASQARNLKGFKINQGSVISKAIPVSIIILLIFIIIIIIKSNLYFRVYYIAKFLDVNLNLRIGPKSVEDAYYSLKSISTL